MKGFTLIELLIVIAVIAVLSVVVILALNPAEILRQARDANRVNDLGTLKRAIAFYLADVRSPKLAEGFFGYGGCYMSTIGSNVTTTARCGVFAGSYTNIGSVANSYIKIDGDGWLPINFTQISSRAPFGQLPIDPTNNQNYYYAYAASSTRLQFEINAFMESAKYGASGTRDVASTDGGNNNSAHEVGSSLSL